MALCKPDFKLREAQKVIESLDDSKDNELIKYYIQKKDEDIDKQRQQLNEYSDFFRMLEKFLPNKNVKY